MDVSNSNKVWGASARRGLAGVSALALLAAASTMVQAQTTAATTAGAATETVTEVVVTAARRGEQTTLTTPQAVDAYSGKTLQDYKVQSMQDLNKINPSLVVVSVGTTQQQVVIRGISSSVGQTTGLYLDEAPLLGGFNGNVPGDGSPGLRLHDLDHVEVLKGPQGTLFGAGSMDGTLRVVTQKPKLDRYEGSVDGSLAGVDGGGDYYDGSIMLNAPIVQDKLGVRIVGWGEGGGGYIDKTINGVTHDNVNNGRLLGGRAEVLWKPIDRLSLEASVNSQHVSVNGPQYATSSVGYTTTPSSLGKYQNFDPIAEAYNDEYNLFSLTGEYDLGFGSVIAGASYGHKRLKDVEDTSGQACLYGFCSDTPIFPTNFTSNIDFTDWTSEVRFSSKFSGPFQIVAGAYYEQDRKTYDGGTILADRASGVAPCENYQACSAQGLIQPGFGASPVLYAFREWFNVDQYAVYAQGDYKILDNLTATFGVRYFSASLNDRQLHEQDVYPDYVFGIVTTPYANAKQSTTQSQPTYNLSLLWQATPSVSLYARAASGFRIGGINNAAALAAQEGVTLPSSYAPDKLWDYEIGAKAYLLDRRLFLDLSLYHIDWKDQQVNALAFGTYNYEVNAGETKTNGVELSGTYRPISGLTLAGSVTYVDARLSTDLPGEVVDGGTPGLKGDRVPEVPNWSYSGQVEYERPLTGELSGYVQTDFNYKGASYTQFRQVTAAQIADGIPNNYDTRIPSYFIVDARVGARFKRVDVSLFVQNLTNEFAVVGVKADVNSVRLYTARPRTVGVSVSARF
jgi:iron complex outermembrane recepter protein